MLSRAERIDQWGESHEERRPHLEAEFYGQAPIVRPCFNRQCRRKFRPLRWWSEYHSRKCKLQEFLARKVDLKLAGVKL